jgi:uncharacterized membrane protein YeaQ/YmgE (transglycosylase-associated protein family)
MNILIWLICGVIAGWITGLIMKGGGFGLIGDLIVGLIGGLIGGWVAGKIGLGASGLLGEILVAVLGGVILVAVLRLFRRV